MSRETSVDPRRLKGVCFGHLSRFRPATLEEATGRLDSVFGSKVEDELRERWVIEWWEKTNPPATPTPAAPESDYRSLVKARWLQVHLGASSLERLAPVFQLVEELGGLSNAQRALESLESLQNIGLTPEVKSKRDS